MEVTYITMPAQKRKNTGGSSAGKSRKTASRKTAGAKPRRASALTTTRKAETYASYHQMMKNPFLSKTGVQLQDSWMGFSVPMALSQTIPLQTSASTTFSTIKFRPSLEDFYATNGTASTITNNTWNNYSEHFEYSAGQQLTDSCFKYRILTYAVSAQYIGPEDSMAGTISWIFVNNSGNTPTDASTWPDTHSQGSGIVPVSRKTHTLVVRPHDRPSFISMNDAVEEYMGGLAIAFNGVNFEHILLKTKLMVELIPKAESSLQDTATQSPGGLHIITPHVSNSAF